MITRLIAIGSAAAILSTASIAGADQTFKARMSGDADNAARGNVYVNAHSVAKPGGVARGQLHTN